jgi:hypothetical protein
MVLAVRHVSVGVACAAGLVTVTYATEQTFLRSLRSMFSNGGATKQD